MASDLTVQSSTKTLLSTLSCPFTWELTDIAVSLYISQDNNAEADEDEEDLPIVCIITSLVRCYESILCADTKSAKKKLDEAEIFFQTIQQKEDLFYLRRVIEHIFSATKCYFFYETEDEESLDQTLRNISHISCFNRRELVALEGCKSIAFSMYYEFGIKRCIAAATEAVKGDEHNPLWHFILAKSLRRERRLIHIQSQPTDLEKKHFERAYFMSKHPIFGIYFVQMKRESIFITKGNRRSYELKEFQDRELFKLYKEIFDLETQNYKVLLKLAHGFLKLSKANSNFAIKCLDIVDELSPDNPCSYHYRAMYHQYRGEHKEAIKYFQQAANLMNFSAELHYVGYGWQIKHLHPTSYLLKMLEKYKSSAPARIQQINLCIATSYYTLTNSVKDAAMYYLTAIKIDPDSAKLHKFYKFLNFDTRLYKDGIYDFLLQKFLPNLKRVCSDQPQLADTYDQLKLACDTYFAKKASNVNEQLKRWAV